MDYRSVLLDVDGTLVDSNDAHAHAWVEVLAKYGHEVSYARVRRMIGMGGDRLIEEAAGIPRGDKESEKIGEARSELFREKWIHQVKPMLGARSLVLQLQRRGCEVAIASAAKVEELQPLLEIADVHDLVEQRTTSSDVEESKPAPDIVEAALAKIWGERSRAVMVGDTPYDLRAARDAGVAMIGVTCGGWSVEAFSGAVGVFRNPADLALHW
jgi:HAD superfamily hydrolase (TIGR01509 family)